MSDKTPVDVALAQAVIDNFHCPDDKHSSWWLNTDELRHAFVPILSAYDESVRAEERERIAQDIRTENIRHWREHRTTAPVYRNGYDEAMTTAARIVREGA